MPKLKTTIEYALYLLVFLLPWQTRLILRPGFFEYGTLSVYGTDIVLVFALLLFAASKYPINNNQYQKNTQIQNPKYQIPDTKYWIAIALLELSILLSIFHSPDKLAAVQKYIHFLLGVGLFWLVTKAEYSRLKLLYAFLAGACLQAALAIWQFLTQSAFAWKWLGLAGHTPFDLGHSVIETVSGRWLRAYGGLDHPNILGGYLVVGIFLCVYAFLMVSKFEEAESGIKNQESRIKNQESGIKNQESVIMNKLRGALFILYFLFFILLVGIFFSFSRTAWLALFFSGLSAIFFGLWKKGIMNHESRIKSQESRIKKQNFVGRGFILYSLFFIPLFLFLILGIIYKDLVMTRLSGEGRLEAKSTIERVASLTGAQKIIRDNWLLGVGAGNYVQHQREINPGLNPWEYQPVHNVFLLVFAELGISGFIIFVGLILNTIYLILKIRTDQENLFIGLSLLAALLVLLTLDHWLWSFHFGQLLFWLVLGVVKNRSVC